MSITNFGFKKELLRKLNIDEKDKNKVLEVGFFKESTYPNGEFVANVAKDNEFGRAKIPPRPFFRNCNSQNQKKWFDFFGKNLIAGKGLNNCYELLGEMIRSDIILSINRFTTPPNAPSTIAKKKSSHPLIDSGKMRQSVNFQIKERK